MPACAPRRRVGDDDARSNTPPAQLVDSHADDHYGHIMNAPSDDLPHSTSSASVAQLKARLSEYLRAVRSGEEVTVTDRGRPVARLVPMDLPKDAPDVVRSLVSRGLAREPRGVLPAGFRLMPRPADPAGRGVEALLEERAEDR